MTCLLHKMMINKTLDEYTNLVFLNILFVLIILASSCSQLNTQLIKNKPEIKKEQTQILKPELVVQLLHGKPVIAMSLSGNGEYLATSSWDKTIRLWNVKTGKQLREFKKKTNKEWLTSHALALSHDGKWLLSGGSDSNIYLWSTITGEIISQYQGHAGKITALDLSNDERFFISAAIDKNIKYWPIQFNTKHFTQKENLAQSSGKIHDIQLTPDGKSFVLISKNRALLTSLASGTKPKNFSQHPAGISALAISSDGKYILTGDLDNNIWLSDAKTQKKVKSYTGHQDKIIALAFSPDAKQFMSTSQDNSVRLWNIEQEKAIRTLQYKKNEFVRNIVYLDEHNILYNKGEELLIYNNQAQKNIERFAKNSGWTSSIALSNNDQYLLVGSWDHTAYLWDLHTGMLVHHLKGHKHHVRSVAFSVDNTMAATAARDGKAIIWDIKSGNIIKEIQRSDKGIKSIFFAPDNNGIILGDDSGLLWFESVKENTSVNNPDWQVRHEKRIESVAYTPNGQLVISSSGSLISIQDSFTGKLKHSFDKHSKPVYTLDVSSDGMWIASAGIDPKILIHHIESGKIIAQLDNTIGVIYSVKFSPDGKYLAIAGNDNTIQLWDIDSKQLTTSFISDTNTIIDLSFSHDGKYLLSSGADQTTQIWNLQLKKNVASVIGFKDGDWAVVDQQGRYDASNGGDIPSLHWVIGREPIQLSQLKQRYYEPALLSKVMGYNFEPIRNINAFSDPKLYPEIKTSWESNNKKILNIHLTDQGGGIGRVVILVNNKEVTSDARQYAEPTSSQIMTIRYDLTNHPYLIPGKENTVEVYAYNDENYLSSRGVGQVFTPPAIAQDMTPTLWAVISGISDYQGQRIDLRYAAKDAVDFNKALTLGAKKLFGSDNVNIRLLTTADGSNTVHPTRKAFIEAFEQLKDAKPWDVLVIYLAGHGLSIKDEYYYLTAEAGTIDLSDPEIVKHLMISGSELTHWLKSTPIQKQLMLLDTCAAGSLANSFSETREISSGQIRAIERMKDRTGLHVLMGSAANAVSYEASQFEQGLMTYALLQGFKGAALKDNELVDVSQLIHYVADTVPELATEIGGIQRPRIASPGLSESFSIGFLDNKAQTQVPLAIRKAILLKPVFINETTLIDDLNLSENLRRYFREQNYSKNKSEKFNPVSLDIAYIDVDLFPSAINVSGLYRRDGNKLHIRFGLGSDKKHLSSKKIVIPIEGNETSHLRNLSETLANEIYQSINRSRTEN
ncbi:MAG: caspase family protein [Gammaproteobacteria bacterium]|nr:caspase family protein [Gammaproteobacteria bacterium]